MRELLLSSLFLVVGCSIDIKGDTDPRKSDSTSTGGSATSSASAVGGSSDSLVPPPMQAVLVGACHVKTSSGEFGDTLRLLQSGKAQRCDDYFISIDSSMTVGAYSKVLRDSCQSRGGVLQEGQTCQKAKSGVQVLTYDDLNGSRLYLRFQYSFQNLDPSDFVFVKALAKGFVDLSSPDKPAAVTPDLK